MSVKTHSEYRQVVDEFYAQSASISEDDCRAITDAMLSARLRTWNDLEHR
jgi:hypothetical protein